MKNVLFLPFAISLLLGCEHMRLQQEMSNLDQIKNGMTKSEVFAVMGRANDNYKFGLDEIWFWNNAVVSFNNSKVVNRATKESTKFELEVESFAGEDPKRRFATILPSVQGMTKNDLEFIAIKKGVQALLEANGYTISEDSKLIDIVVFVNFGVSEPQVETKIWSEPVYEMQMPLQSPQANTTSNVYNQYGQNVGSVQSQTNYGNPYAVSIPQQVYRGERTRSEKITTFNRHLVLEAIDYQNFLKTKEMKPFWKVSSLSTGSSNNFRLILPYLLISVSSYLESDSNGKVKALLFENDIRTKQNVWLKRKTASEK